MQDYRQGEKRIFKVRKLFSNQKLKDAYEMYLKTYKDRCNFLYKVSKDSNDWDTSSWLSVSNGFSEKKQRAFLPRLPDKAIIDVLNGRKTSINNGNKRIDSVEYLGCRFGKYTDHFDLDIDNKCGATNEYYSIETVDKILDVTKHIGTPIFLQSSHSKGWHLRWYFDEQVLTWRLAVYLKELFTNNGFSIDPGKLEIFPNKKSSPDSLYKGLRLPCQKGSALLSLENARVLASWEEDPQLLVIYWAEEVTKNIIEAERINTLINACYSNGNLAKWHKEYITLKEMGLTGASQRNTVLGKIAKGLVVFEGITDVKRLTVELCNWISNKHNGFSKDYNENPQEVFAHCARWAIYRLKRNKPLSTTNTKQNASNRAKSGQYDYQLNAYLEKGLLKPEMSIRQIAEITQIPKSSIERRKNMIYNQHCPDTLSQ